MDSRLFIEIGINNDGDLEVVDQTPYEQWIIDDEFDADHQVLERVVLVTGDEEPEIIAFSNIHGSTPEELRHSTVYDVPGNGLYHYQKLVIPTYTHTESHANETLYYRDGSVYFTDLDSGITKVWSNLEEDIDEIYEIAINQRLNNCFHFDEDSFSMYNLVVCYALIEQQRLQNYIKNRCFGGCNSSDNLDTKADILLSALIVIRDLIEKGEFFEAQRILNGLNTCGKLCEDAQVKLKGCGCGTT